MPYIKQKFKIPKPTKAYQFLMQTLHLNMAQSQQYINKGRVFYYNQVLQEKNKILENYVEILIFQPQYKGLKPLFENADFAIFNKPAKMLIHPKGRFKHHSFIDEVRFLYGKEANLVHRIDKETSGLVLVGKHKKALVELGELFLQKEVVKKYLALVKGHLSYGDFCLSLPLATQKKGGDLSVRSVYEQTAQDLKFKPAQSEFEILGLVYGAKNCYTLLKVFPQTGRTHQIRLHLHALGYSILGDPLYGARDSYSRAYLDAEFIGNAESQNTNGLCDSQRLEYFGATRLMLHAYSLEFCYQGQKYYFATAENFAIPFLA